MQILNVCFFSMSDSSDTNESMSEEIPQIDNPQDIETDEDIIFQEKAILYRFSNEKSEWVGRGSGIIKILKHKQTGAMRILMRQNKTFLLRCNHLIPYCGFLHSLPGYDKEFSWTAYDFTDTQEPEIRELFAVKFALPSIAQSFKSQFEIGQRTNKAIMRAKNL